MIYDEFLAKCSTEQVDGEAVGKVIVSLTQEFINHNLRLVNLEMEFNKVAVETVNSINSENGKLISVSKAEILVRDTEEYRNLKEIKIDLENIEQCINSLKYLQRAITQEYMQAGGV